MTRLLGIGDNTVDIYVDQGMQFPGGNAVNVAVLARRLGVQASYLGCIGTDRLGSIVREALQAEAVDVSRVRVIDAPNSWSRIRHVDNDRIFDGSRPGLRGCYNLQADDFTYMAAHDLAHSSVYSKLEDDLEAIKRAAPLLSFDYSSEFNTAYLRATAPHLDIAFLSDADSSESACLALCRDVADLGPTTIIVTRGRNGAIAWRNGTVETQGIIDGPVVDTLGAGDGFIAAFLLATLKGRSLPSALARGAEHALHVCSYRGAFGHGSPIQPSQPGLAESGVGTPGGQRTGSCHSLS